MVMSTSKTRVSPHLERTVCARGFTLMELITAITIFSMLGVMLLSMVRNGMSMWKKGEASRSEMELGMQVLETISGELRLAFTENAPLAGAPEAMLVCDFFEWDRDNDGVKEARTQRLRFIRINVEERENTSLSRAGDFPDGYRHFTSWEEPEPKEALPTGGLAETMFMSYAPRLAKGEPSDGILSLYRGYRTPPGGEGGFFDPRNLRDPKQLETAMMPVISGVLYLEFRFWNQLTRSFDPRLFKPEDRAGAGYTWDSTRGLLPDEAAAWPNGFRFGRGGGSFDDCTDDLFPSKVLVTTVVDDPLATDMTVKTVDDIGASQMSIPVDAVKPFKDPGGESAFVKIGEEWMEISGSSGSDLLVKRRGVRHTIAAPHKAGCAVRRGRIFSAVVEIATAKSCWNDYESE